jgi:hypothetical protein
MISRRIFTTLALSAALAGCVSLPPIRFSPDEIKSWRYVGTRVVAATDAQFQWHGLDTTFAESKGIKQVAIPVDPAGGPGAADANADYAARVRQLVMTEPTRSEFQRFIISQAHGPISAAMGEQLGGQMTGGREVRVEVTVKHIIINHTALRILVDLIQSMKTEVALVDVKTGEKLAVYPEVTAVVQRKGGVAGIIIDAAITRSDIDMLSASVAVQTKWWLFNR